MYAHLTGHITHLGADHAIIDVSGVGYLIHTTSRTLGALGVGQQHRLHTHLNVREDALTLFGFSEATEKDFFLLLTTVSGVGPKMALSLLSTWSPQDIVAAIQSNQPAVLARASGVGKKLAEKIIVELKDKVGSLVPLFAPNTASQLNSMVHDITSALTNLGYPARLAETGVMKAMEELPNASFEDIFKLALKKVS